MKWNIGKPGGMNGPFYSVVSSTGEVIAMQITKENYAETLAKFGNAAIANDFDTIHHAAKELRSLFLRDKFTVDEGTEAYIIRTVLEALMS